MGPPRRNSSHTHSPSSDSFLLPHSPHAQIMSADSQESRGMSPASRYQHNLRVLRRRDPSILSIFDQFSHVCLYHHNGKKWEKHGYEGSMFLYERNTYPPYAFYILNRMGMEDHIQHIHPEDNIGSHGSYLIIRSYPEFTSRRLASARTSASHEDASNKFSNIYALPNIDHLTSAEKGDSETIGLWMFTTDSREPLFDVFSRLHYYIKQNLPYPQEYRYGPDRPRPPYLSTRATVTDPMRCTTPERSSGALANVTSPLNQYFPPPSEPPDGLKNGASELDKLFAKIELTPVLSDALPSQIPHPGSKMTVESLFASFNTQDTVKNVNVPAPSNASSVSTPSTGINLLNHIFASAESSKFRPTGSRPLPAADSNPTPATKDHYQNFSPSPITTSHGSQPLRRNSSSSVTCSSKKADIGDECDFPNQCLVSNSRCSSAFDEDRTATTRYYTLKNVTSKWHPTSSPNNGENGKTRGDTTPRAQMNGFLLDATSLQSNGTRDSHSPVTLPPSIMSANSASTVTAGSSRHTETTAESRSRTLVPFESDSELWPYSRGDIYKPSTDHGNYSSLEGDSDEVLELDFEDTSILNDPNWFDKGKEWRGMKFTGTSMINGNKVEGTREWMKGKKDRKMKNMRKMEDYWDLPDQSKRAEESSPRNVSYNTPSVGYSKARLPKGAPKFPTVAGLTTDEEDYSVPPPPASPSPSPSPTSSPSPLAPRGRGYEFQHLSISACPESNIIKSQSSVVSSVNRKLDFTEQAISEYSDLKGKKGVVDTDVVRESLVSAVAGHGGVQAGSRNDFVREVLSLIHMDKSFVDALWKDYHQRVTSRTCDHD